MMHGFLLALLALSKECFCNFFLFFDFCWTFFEAGVDSNLGNGKFSSSSSSLSLENRFSSSLEFESSLDTSLSTFVSVSLMRSSISSLHGLRRNLKIQKLSN